MVSNVVHLVTFNDCLFNYCYCICTIASFLEENIFKWYCIIVGGENTRYAGIPIRFTLEFDKQYPSTPPKAYFETYVAYHNGATMKDKYGRTEVCLNIFGNFSKIHTEWATTEGEGWSPSYTVSTILITMQGLMMSDMLSTSASDIHQTRTSASSYKCNDTKHDGSSSLTWYPSVFTSTDEINAYQKENDIVKEKFEYNLLKDHYICYIKKTNVLTDKCILGYGIHVENPRINTLSSPCEYLSYEAFYPGCSKPSSHCPQGIRKSTLNKPIEYWLPVLIHSTDWDKVKPLFLQCVSIIENGLGLNPTARSENVLKICCSVMNTLVVEVMNGKNNKSNHRYNSSSSSSTKAATANDKFIDGYFAFYRLLKQYSSDHKDLIAIVNHKISQFISSASGRVKKVVPNLGELLIYLTITETYAWSDMSAAFLEESDARSVFWYCIGNSSNPPSYPELLNTTSINTTSDSDRLKKVFQATSVGRSLTMYQVRFAQIVKNYAESVTTTSAATTDTNTNTNSANTNTKPVLMESSTTLISPSPPPPVVQEEHSAPVVDEWETVASKKKSKKNKTNINKPLLPPVTMFTKQSPPLPPPLPVLSIAPTFDTILDTNHGIIPVELQQQLKDYYIKINKVTNWEDYFVELDLPNYGILSSIENRTASLVQAITTSQEQGYTTPNTNNTSNSDCKYAKSFSRGYRRNY